MKDVREELVDALRESIAIEGVEIIIDGIDAPIFVPPDDIMNPGVNAITTVRKLETMQFDHLVAAFKNEIERDIAMLRTRFDVLKFGILFHQVPVPHSWNMVRYTKVVRTKEKYEPTNTTQ
jgi:hypothetical protein